MRQTDRIARLLTASLVVLVAACRVRDRGAPLSEYPGAPFEDRRGDLWFPTAFDGVIRYDGLRFTTFGPADGLPSRTVRDVFEDRDGTLWFATGGGLVRYDGRTFSTVADYEGAAGETGFGGHGHHRDLWGVHRDRNGTLWIATMDGVWRRVGARFVRFPLAAQRAPHEHEFTANMVYGVFEDRQGVLWFATDGVGVVRWDGTTQRAYTTADGLCSDHVTTVAQDRRGHYWFGSSNGGVSRFDGARFSTHLRNARRSVHDGWGRVLDVLVARDGAVWFARSSAGGGVYRFDGSRFERLGEERGLSAGGVIGVSEDRAGRIWVGSTGGVYRLDGARFVHFGRPTR